MKRILSFVCIGTLILSIGCGLIWAQAVAQISGIVRDQSGAVLPGVEVTVTQTETGVSRGVVSNETGSYVLPNLPLGPYRLEASLPGFRTYVQTGGKPGVFFFSLDAGSLAAVTAARTLLNLPYYAASMEVQPWGDGVSYKSSRSDDSGARFEATYQPEGGVFTPIAGTLDCFLTERYCLYHVDHGGHPYRLDIHHPPWPLQHARSAIAANTMLDIHRLTPLESSPLLHFAKRQDMVAWAPERL